MQVVWEANTADFAKRKRAARACLPCQKRKKRCHHTFSKDSTGGSSIVLDEYSSHSDLDRMLPNLTHKEPIRFVGDLNPESILADLSSRSKGAARDSRVGTWLEPSHEAGSHDAIPNVENDPRIPVAGDRYKAERAPRTLSEPLKQYLQAVGAFRILPRETQDILVTSFISCVDNLLPLLDGGKLLKKYAAGTVSIFLIQAICLVTCKTEEAAPYLRLTEGGPLLEPIPFARSLHTGLDAAMKADLESDRLTKVQILSLMSLHNDGPGEFEESSMHLAQAIHNAHTAGLHIHTAGRRTNDEASYAWWCIWAMDKFNACLSGRAVMIADRDIGIARPDIEDDERSQSLAMWLALADLLEAVIGFYRPTANQDSTGWEANFPTFQEISYDTNIRQISHRNFLELCYNVIAILTCRSGGPTTTSYSRRVAAADRIQQIMTGARDDHLPPLPMVPYAVSLSLTVSYRVLRDKHSSNDLLRAKQALTTRCEILECLSVRWWSADAMAKLGRKALGSLKMGKSSGSEVAAVAGMMEAEVAVCKHISFEGQRPPPPQSLGMTSNRATLETARRSNALDLLSAAAATHASQHPSLENSSLYSVSGPMEDMTLPPFAPVMENGVMADQFQNLDMLFGDFFDLAMPTFFEDPLFEGSAFAGYPEIVQ